MSGSPGYPFRWVPLSRAHWEEACKEYRIPYPWPHRWNDDNLAELQRICNGIGARDDLPRVMVHVLTGQCADAIGSLLFDREDCRRQRRYAQDEIEVLKAEIARLKQDQFELREKVQTLEDRHE